MTIISISPNEKLPRFWIFAVCVQAAVAVPATIRADLRTCRAISQSFWRAIKSPTKLICYIGAARRGGSLRDFTIGRIGH